VIKNDYEYSYAMDMHGLQITGLRHGLTCCAQSSEFFQSLKRFTKGFFFTSVHYKVGEEEIWTIQQM
jgi:hypothetical protein